MENTQELIKCNTTSPLLPHMQSSQPLRYEKALPLEVQHLIIRKMDPATERVMMQVSRTQKALVDDIFNARTRGFTRVEYYRRLPALRSLPGIEKAIRQDAMPTRFRRVMDRAWNIASNFSIFAPIYNTWLCIEMFVASGNCEPFEGRVISQGTCKKIMPFLSLIANVLALCVIAVSLILMYPLFRKVQTWVLNATDRQMKAIVGDDAEIYMNQKTGQLDIRKKI